MPQIRHADTSALIAEGPNVHDLLIVADVVGLDRVAFDGVGVDFDPVAELALVRAQRDELAARVSGAAPAPPDGPAAARADLEAYDERVRDLEGDVADMVDQAVEFASARPDAVGGEVVVVAPGALLVA